MKKSILLCVALLLAVAFVTPAEAGFRPGRMAVKAVVTVATVATSPVRLVGKTLHKKRALACESCGR
jgi:hypothetical protein